MNGLNMNGPNFKVSVVIPCHNASATIEETLESVWKQTLLPHEVIVIDDQSTDDSRAIVRAWTKTKAESGVQVLLLERAFGNAALTRNAGIEEASGDWIALLDADDLWYPEHLANAAALLSSAPSSAVAFMANHEWLDANGTRPMPPGMAHTLDEARTDLPAREFVEILARGFHFGHSTVIYRRERVVEVGGFDGAQKRRHDLDLWLRLTREHLWAYSPRKAAVYRLDTPGSISKSVVSCEQFYLLALLRNRACFEGAAMNTLVKSAARRLMSMAFVDGTRDEFRAARRLAMPYLSPFLRVFYALAPLARPLLRRAIRLKRRWIWRHAPENLEQAGLAS